MVGYLLYTFSRFRAFENEDIAIKLIMIFIILYSLLQILITSFFMTTVVEILLQRFSEDCKSVEFEDFLVCGKFVNQFEDLEQMFKNFFFAYYTYVQLFSIFNIFTSILYFLGSSLHQNEQGSYLETGGLTIFMVCYIYKLDYLTLQADNAFHSIKDLGNKVDEHLLKTQIKSERQQLKFISKRIDRIQPFSACGYFDIGKGTLTSMLSVRWDKKIFNQFHRRIFISFWFQFDIYYYIGSVSTIQCQLNNEENQA